jgi:hypothetical protein
MQPKTEVLSRSSFREIKRQTKRTNIKDLTEYSAEG